MADKNNITIYDIAKRAGVSRQTVSRVLNNRQDVSAETRKRVQKIMEELSYHPSAVARSLSRQKSYILGVVTAGLKYIGPSRTLNGITSKAEELGYGLLLKELASFGANNVQPLFGWFQSHQVDGIIWAVPEIGDNRNWLKELLPEIKIPIIFLTMEKRDDVSIVELDNYLGAQKATEHLISLGKKNIGHITGPLDWWEARQRKLGWEISLSDAGYKLSDRMWAEGNWSSKSGKTAFTELVEKFPEMDGVFVGNDQMALSVLQTAFEQGKRIPEDLAVVGFDGIPESEFYCPSLSTVNQNQTELGCIAVDELVKLIQNRLTAEDVIEPKYLTLKPELIIRQSSRIVSKGGEID
ncbi:MAG: LacI family DNA-binding transcriptional regulator [Anaerolineales bacterium]|jgi:LacI family transcriptional regulator